MPTVGTMTLAEIIQAQNALVREGEYNERSGTGGYRVLGKLIELRHEIARDANEPDREITRKVGVSMDWKHWHNGPLIGLTKDRTQLLFLSKVNPLPDIIDPEWKPTQYVETKYGHILAAALEPEERKALGIELEDTPMVKQRFIDHMNGRFGDFMVCGPLTQALFKVDGLPGFTTIDFKADLYAGEHAHFFVDPATGEGHICGGEFLIAALKT